MSVSKNYLSIEALNNSKISYGFFTRNGGYSKKKFKSLNCNASSDDKIKIVNKNKASALKQLHLEQKKLVLVKQTHSSKVIILNKNNQNQKMEADGIITSLNNIVIGVLTADCAPIFIFDINKQLICCLHSGWKGTLNNISKNAVKIFDKKKIKRNNLIAIVGPCLAMKNYEVDKKFEKNFLDRNSQYYKFFKYKNKFKSFFNLRGIINFQLRELGLKTYNINKDTYSNDSLFFSHRRSTHKGQQSSGRLINIISLT